MTHPDLNTFSLFNAADECLSPLVSEQHFDESLVLNVLFQDRLLLHDAYYFASGSLARHVLAARHGVSLFEHASSAGIIVPAYRDASTASLHDSFRALERVYGDYPFLHPETKSILPRLYAAVDQGQERQSPVFWPTQERGYFGDLFKANVVKFLQADDPPLPSGVQADRVAWFSRVWKLSERWRWEGINEAIARTETKGQIGLQRAELYDSLGHILGMPSDRTQCTLPELMTQCSDDEEKEAVRVWWKWVCQCHHVSYAEYLGISVNFPVYNLDTDFMVDSLLRSPLDAPPDDVRAFRSLVRIPTIKSLTHLDPRTLLEIRRTVGAGYLWASREWAHSPTEATELLARSELARYCESLCRAVPGSEHTQAEHLLMPPNARLTAYRQAVSTIRNLPVIGAYVKVIAECLAWIRLLSPNKGVQAREVEVTLGTRALGHP